MLSEVTAPFELFGGPHAVNVARLDAGRAGWLISGNRFAGAAVWLSPDAAAFWLVEGAPELASDDRGDTWAFDAVALPEGWLVVGGVVPTGRVDRDPLGWMSADGRTWRRVPGDGSDAYEELHRVVLADGVALAVGLGGTQFRVWRRDGDAFRSVAGFGTVGGDGRSGVRALTAVGGRLVAVTSDGTRHAVWTSADSGSSWTSVVTPTILPAGAEQVAAVAGAGDRLLLLVDDGSCARLHMAETGW